MAEKGRIAYFQEGILTIVAEDEAWLEQMLSMRGMLEHELARIAEVKLAGIHFIRPGAGSERR